MMRGALVVAALASVLFFPWPVAALLALAGALLSPWLPLAVGLFADTLYFTPHAGAVPLATLLGALATAVALFVRSRLATGIIGR